MKESISRKERSISKPRQKRATAKESSPERNFSLNLLDMRHMLGFLNQSEWVTTLNIGNIMQISPIQHEDLITHKRNEQEITRDAFLESVTIKPFNICLGQLYDSGLLLHIN